jgi:hypothetical protein
VETILTVGLVAAIGTAVTAMHLRLTTRPPEPAIGWSVEDIDAEFFSIVERERLRESQ